MSEKGRTFAPHLTKEASTGFRSSDRQRVNVNGNSRKETPRVWSLLYFSGIATLNPDIMKVTINLKKLPAGGRLPFLSAMLDKFSVVMSCDGISVSVDEFDTYLTAMWGYFAYVSRGLEESGLASLLMSFRYPLQVESEKSGRVIALLVWCEPESGIHYCYERELQPGR